MLVVAEGTREIGVRPALGATPADIVGFVLGGALRLTIRGAILGLVVTGIATRLLHASSLFAVGSLDPSNSASTVALFGLVMVIAAAVPVRRALATDAITSLRTD